MQVICLQDCGDQCRHGNWIRGEAEMSQQDGGLLRLETDFLFRCMFLGRQTKLTRGTCPEEGVSEVAGELITFLGRESNLK